MHNRKSIGPDSMAKSLPQIDAAHLISFAAIQTYRTACILKALDIVEEKRCLNLCAHGLQGERGSGVPSGIGLSGGLVHCCQHRKEEEMQMCLWAESTHIRSSPELPAVAVPMK